MPLFVDNDCDLVIPQYSLSLDGSPINDSVVALTIADTIRTGPVTQAANTPIVITSAAHGLSTGQQVVVTQCRGNTAANGVWTVTALTTDTFRLDGSSSNATFLPDAKAKWNLVVPGAASISVAKLVGVNGKYRAVIPCGDLPLVAGKNYLLVIKSANYDDQIERIEAAQVRTS